MDLLTLKQKMDAQGYVYDDTMATVLYVALTLGRPLLIEGAAGVGKTEIAKVMASALDRDLVRLQCYEGLDESKALYEWNYQKQLLSIQVNMANQDKDELTRSLFSDEYLLERPLLQSIRSEKPVVLLSREWKLRPGAISSRDWERSRLAALYALAQGTVKTVVTTADALMARTMPPELMTSLAVTLEIGGRVDLKALADRLLSAGYVRCEQVEGVGQFALRGGILDVFPAGDTQPIRAEFWGDDVDSLGRFDPLTQRRSEPVSSVTILPVREALPTLAEGGIDGLCAALRKLAGRKATTDKLEKTLLSDADALAELRYLPAADRYLPQIYPELATAFSWEKLKKEDIYLNAEELIR